MPSTNANYGKWLSRMPAAAGIALFLFSGCAWLGRRERLPPPETLFSKADFAVLMGRLRAAEEGRKILNAISLPIKIMYDDSIAKQHIIGSNSASWLDGRRRPAEYWVYLHPNLKKIPTPDSLVAIVVSHELTHVTQSTLPPEQKSLMAYSEEDAYAASMRVWIELDPEGRRPLPRGMVLDFEGKDITDVLVGLRSVYERSLEDFTDAIQFRYYRLCRFQSGPSESFCGGPWISFKERLRTTRDTDTIKGWALLRQRDAPFREQWLKRRSSSVETASQGQPSPGNVSGN